MARAPRNPRPEPNASVLQASARRIDIRDPKERERIRKRQQDWQAAAYGYYDSLGEVDFAHRYLSNMCSRVRLFPAYRPDPNADPIPLDPDDADQRDDGMELVAKAARVELDRLAGPMGGHGHLLGPLAANLGIVGEAYLCGFQDATIAGGERWEIYSVDELQADDSSVWIKEDETDNSGQKLPPDSVAIRIWRRHPRWSQRADAPMRAALATCEELLLLSRAIRASAMSRLNAGLLLLPSELTFPQRETAPGDGQASGDDPFLAEMLQTMLTPIQDPDSAAAIVPLLVKGPASSLEQVRHLVLSRPVEATQLEQRKELRHTLATALDLPAEVLEGFSDANHWTAWQVDSQTFKAHLEPLVLVMTSAITSSHLQPAIAAQGFDPAGVVCWHDPEDLLGDEDAFENAVKLHEAIVVSDAYLRRKGGASEDDAPDDAEKAERAERKRPASPFGGGAGPSTSEEPPGERSETGPPEGTAALRAAGTPRTTRLSIRLAEIDRSLRRRIHGWADASVQRALEVAGAQLRRRAQGDRELAARLKPLPSAEIPSALGRVLVSSWGLAEEDLISDELADLESRYRAATSAAAREAIRAAQAELEIELEDAEMDRLLEERDTAIGAGWLVLAGAVAETARERLFSPHPSAPEAGEFDPFAIVPPSSIRESLAVAGGAPAAGPDPVTGRPSGGVATGELTQSMLDTLFGVSISGGRWLYGDPSARNRSFVPHEILDGIEFGAWDDPVLTNEEVWPPFPFFFPGDHDYCQCDYVPTLAERGTQEA